MCLTNLVNYLRPTDLKMQINTICVYIYVCVYSVYIYFKTREERLRVTCSEMSICRASLDLRDRKQNLALGQVALLEQGFLPITSRSLFQFQPFCDSDLFFSDVQQHQ